MRYLILFTILLLLASPCFGKKIDKAEKKGAKITAKILDDVDKHLKKAGKTCDFSGVVIGETEDVDLADLIYDCMGADKKEKKLK